jgi:hypothetical protein
MDGIGNRPGADTGCDEDVRLPAGPQVSHRLGATGFGLGDGTGNGGEGPWRRFGLRSRRRQSAPRSWTATASAAATDPRAALSWRPRTPPPAGDGSVTAGEPTGPVRVSDCIISETCSKRDDFLANQYQFAGPESCACSPVAASGRPAQCLPRCENQEARDMKLNLRKIPAAHGGSAGGGLATYLTVTTHQSRRGPGGDRPRRDGPAEPPDPDQLRVGSPTANWMQR